MSDKTYVVDTTHSPHAALHSVPIAAVHLSDTFLEPRRRTNRILTIPSQYEHCEATNRIRNFERVVNNDKDTPFEGIFFNDSDIYKWLEAAASALADPALENRAEVEAEVARIVPLIKGAQQPDGYLNTYYMWEREKDRFTNLRDMHELYCMGHFIQAAVAHYRATGSETLLNVARRVADLLDNTFGPAETGKREGTCGHEEIELALVELYRATGEKRYLTLADYFVSARGRTPSAVYREGHSDPENRSYWQDHVPYRELQEVTGHAVRALYLATGATDVALETGEPALLNAIHAQWENMVNRRSYISGGVGARWEGEAFGKDYELPADRAYTETCAAIASVMWNYRLLLLTGDAKYADLMEHTFYNAVLPGLSLSGDEYFYQNPLENDGTHRRQKWFGCACCPPNVARLLAQLPGYLYATKGSYIYVSLYAAGKATVPLPNGEAQLAISTNYPWTGEICITLENDVPDLALQLRIPAWAEGATITTASGTVSAAPGAFAAVKLSGKAGETVQVHLPMAVRQVVANRHVGDTGGRVAVFRGPLLYCAEAADNPGVDLADIALPADAIWQEKEVADLPNVTGLTTMAYLLAPEEDSLYRPRPEATSTVTPQEIKLIPYYAWANRDAGAMRVWLQQR